MTQSIQQLNAIVEGWERGFERFCEALGFDPVEVRKSHHIARVHVMGAGTEPLKEFAMISTGELDAQGVAAAAKERYELYRAIWSNDFRDLADAAERPSLLCAQPVRIEDR